MKKKIQEIEDLFKSGIDGYREMPPGEVWSSLDAALEKSNAAHKRLKRLKRWLPLLLFPLAFIIFQIKRVDVRESAARKSENKTDLASGNNTSAQANEQKKMYSDTKTENHKKDPTVRPVREKEITAGNRLKAVSAEVEANDTFSAAKENRRPITKMGATYNSVKNTAISGTKKNALSNSDKWVAYMDGLNKKSASKQSSGRQTSRVNNDKQKLSLNVNANSGVLTNGDESSYLLKNKSLSADIKSPSLPTAKKQNKGSVVTNDTLPYHAFYKPNLAFSSSAVEPRSDSSNYGKATSQNMKPTNSKVSGSTFTGKKGLLSTTIFYSPNFNFSYLKSHKPVEKEDDKDRIKQKEQYSFSSTIGVLADYTISNQWGLETGLALSNTAIQIAPHTIFARQDHRANGNAPNALIKYRINSSAGFAYLPSKISTTLAAGDSIRATKSSNVLQYASVLIGFKNRMTKGKISFAPTGGVWMNFLSRQKFETTLEKGSLKENIIVKRMEGIRPVYFSVMAGCSFEYNVGKRIDVDFTPVAHLGLSSITKDGPVKTYHNSISLMTGVRIKF